jgi:hypothetical protein
MEEVKNSFNIGDVVTYLTHPLFLNLRIKGDSRYVPPIMIIKEVLLENKQKKTFDEETGKQIAERIKYICVYFDDNKSDFVEVHLYESMLRTFEDLRFERISKSGNRIEDYKTLTDEVKGYSIPIYRFGGIVYFKTKKLEIYKKRTSKKIPLLQGSDDVEKIKEVLQYVVNYATPDFVMCGFKKENYTDLFYGDGKVKRLAPVNFLKVKWFNPFQQKFSEIYLPEEFFTGDDVFGAFSIEEDSIKEVPKRVRKPNPSNNINTQDFDTGKNN